eukprot:GEMP01003646.1.p1 GENE.GEMP01003646.1~~GEMP01003646.1.p1  ORF type:complete len:889 (+),score=162.23 GEMP01003646.1:506-3172(+)
MVRLIPVPAVADRGRRSRGSKGVEVRRSKLTESVSDNEGNPSPGKRKKHRGADDVASPLAGKIEEKMDRCKYEPPITPADARRQKARAWVFGAWAYMIALYSAFISIVLGSGAIFFQMRTDNNANLPEAERLYFAPSHAEYYTNWKFRYANYVALSLGIAMFLLPTLIPFFHSSGPPVVSFVRAFVLLVTACICGFSFFMLLPCILYSISCVLTLVSAIRWEEGKFERFGIIGLCGTLKTMIKRCCCARLRTKVDHPPGRGPSQSPSWWRYQVARGVLPRCALLVLWSAINAGLMLKNYKATIEKVASMVKNKDDLMCWMDGKHMHADGESGCLRYGDAIMTYLPIAKACGLCLDFNCALIMLLIVEKIVRKFNQWMGTKSGMLVWVPVHKMLLFHQWVGAAIFLFSLGHTYGHFMAQSFILDVVSRVTTLTGIVNYHSDRWVMLSIWTTGMVLFVLLVVCYGISVGPARRIQYNLFMRVHVGCGLMFIIILFWHAQAFIFWGIVPFILYLIDLAGRSASSETSLRLVEVELIDSVLALTFVTPFKYKSGTYCRLRCHTVPNKGSEWHPFTISSAFSSNTLGFHIKVHPGGWTEGVRDLMIEVARESKKRKVGKKLIDDKSGFRYQFKDRDWLSGHEILGLAPTWKGKPLFVCSAPIAAPAMHHDRFRTIIIAGAGIGLTPVNSVITEMLHYNWRRGMETKVENMYAAWMCPQNNLGAYRWFMESASNCDLAYKLCDSKKNHYEMHIYVTSAAAPIKTATPIVPTVSEIQTYGDDACTAVRPYTASDLLDATRLAMTPIADFPLVMLEKDRAEDRGLSDPFARTHIWNGRPDWDALMERISYRHASPNRWHRVGVFFCGTPVIAEAVRQSAQRYTNSGISFHVFKENF